jgi:hypothetical protein
MEYGVPVRLYVRISNREMRFFVNSDGGGGEKRPPSSPFGKRIFSQIAP